ncbi:MAG: NAD-dependent epimerase/dehydratase family protein [Candidatus Micrarchaeota archaeon]
MKVFVTGGAGFIGSHVCEKLVSLGHEVIAIDNFDPYYGKGQKIANISPLKKSKKFHFLEMSILSPEFPAYLKESGADSIIHLAARPGVRPSLADPFIYQKINVEGTLRVLEACRIADISNLVSISSSSVYGNCKTKPWKETDTPLPASPYGASKLAGEAYVRAYHELYSISAKCLRYFSVYGERQRPDLALALFANAMMENKPIRMFGDGSSLRDYTYISDAVDGTISALLANPDFEIFNIGNSKPVALKRLINLLEQNLGVSAKIERLPEQKGDLSDTYADISKAKKMLNYSPKVGIEWGVKKYIEWRKKAWIGK